VSGDEDMWGYRGVGQAAFNLHVVGVLFRGVRGCIIRMPRFRVLSLATP
jgi:hypothetical protein